MTGEPCTREHLVAIRPSFAYWSVDDDGAAIEQVTDYEDDIGDIEQYICENCHEYFCPDKPNHIDESWRAALEHLKVIRVPELGCCYRWSTRNGTLEYCPQLINGTFDINDWNCVDEDLVGEEPVTYHGKEVTLSDVYRDVERLLGVAA